MKLLVKLLGTLVILIALIGFGVYILENAHDAVPLYNGEEVQPGDLYTLKVTEGTPCVIEINESSQKPQDLLAIKEELRNLALLRDSPNVERETYLLNEVPPYSGTVEVTLHFYGERILEIYARGRGERDLLNRRYSMNSRSELIELRQVKVQPKELDDSEIGIKPIEFLYEIRQSHYAFNYGCILEYRVGSRVLKGEPEQARALSPSEVRAAGIDQTESDEFQNEFMVLLSSVKAERAKTVQDALFERADLPALPPDPASEASKQ